MELACRGGTEGGNAAASLKLQEQWRGCLSGTQKVGPLGPVLTIWPLQMALGLSENCGRAAYLVTPNSRPGV